jgi:hypothetical protein
MKPIVKRLILTIFALMLLTSCATQKITEDLGDSDKTAPPLVTHDTVQKEEPIPEESETTHGADDKAPTKQADDRSTIETPGVTSPEIIELASAENHSLLSYSASLQSDDKGLSSLEITLYDDDHSLIQTLISPVYFDKDWYHMFTNSGGHVCRFVDLNLDGYPDVVTQRYGAMVNQSYDVWLYQPDNANFEISQVYESQFNPIINVTERLILSINYTQGIPTYDLSYIEKNGLSPYASIRGEFAEGAITYTQYLYGYVNEEGIFCFQETPSVTEIASPQALDPIWESFDITMPK